MKHLRRYKTQSVHSAGDTIRKQNTSMSKTGLIRQFNIQKKHTDGRHISHSCYVKIFFLFLCTRGLVADVQPRRKETEVGRGERQTERSWPPHPQPPPPPQPAFSFNPSSRPFTSLRSASPSAQHPPLVLLLYTSPFPLLSNTWNVYIIVWFFKIDRKWDTDIDTYFIVKKRKRERGRQRHTERQRGRERCS